MLLVEMAGIFVSFRRGIRVYPVESRVIGIRGARVHENWGRVQRATRETRNDPGVAAASLSSSLSLSPRICFRARQSRRGWSKPANPIRITEIIISRSLVRCPSRCQMSTPAGHGLISFVRSLARGRSRRGMYIYIYMYSTIDSNKIPFVRKGNG